MSGNIMFAEYNCPKQCGECCKWVYFVLDPRIYNDKISREWCEARGISFDGRGVLLPHRCQHLDDNNRCKIYNTRPIACKAYNCKHDKVFEDFRATKSP